MRTDHPWKRKGQQNYEGRNYFSPYSFFYHLTFVSCIKIIVYPELYKKKLKFPIYSREDNSLKGDY